MGLKDKFKNLVGIEDIDDDDEEFEEELEEAKPERKEEKSFARPAMNQSAPSYKEAPKSEPLPRRTTASDIMKMIVVEPQGFDECPRLVDSLKAKKPVVINLESLDTDVARKIFDFLSGATYALNGNVQKIAKLLTDEGITLEQFHNYSIVEHEKLWSHPRYVGMVDNRSVFMAPDDILVLPGYIKIDDLDMENIVKVFEKISAQKGRLA